MSSSRQQLTSQIDRLDRPRLLVLGDLILDRYTWGEAERVSPEAPVLVLRADNEEVRPGGAASVALLAHSLEADVTLAGITGDDPASRTLLKLLEDESIDHSLVLVDPDRPTTVKERVVGRTAGKSPAGGQQIVRVDHESRVPLSTEIEERLAAAVIGRLDRYDTLLISDYAKGVCTPNLLRSVIEAAKKRNLPVLVDPARVDDYTRYRGATLLKPNRTETEWATGQTVADSGDALHSAAILCRDLELQAVLVTLDREGMVLVEQDGSCEEVEGRPRHVCDITGAGDMALATLGLCVASGISYGDAAQIANAAAGLEVERLGISPVSRAELRNELKIPIAAHHELRTQNAFFRPTRTATPESKIVSLDRLAQLTETYRRSGRRVVLTNGCFDLLHIGHLHTLLEAMALGEVLIVALNSDESVRRQKGAGRPVVPDEQRALLLAAMSCVDHVLVFDEDTPHRLLERLKPDVLAKGGTTDEIVGSEVVETYGGSVRRLKCFSDISTTGILADIEGRFAERVLAPSTG